MIYLFSVILDNLNPGLAFVKFPAVIVIVLFLLWFLDSQEVPLLFVGQSHS